MREKIQQELNMLRKLECEAKKIIQSAPKENLRCAINKGCYQYYIGNKYLGADKSDLIHKIAQKEYCQRLDKHIAKRIRLLEKLYFEYEHQRLVDVYDQMHPGRKAVVTPLIKSSEQIVQDFENVVYEGKGFDPDNHSAFFTMKGERVRSKSEKIIADELHKYSIPYKYEMPLRLKYKGNEVVIYPDFIALNPRTGKRYIIEHLGMLDNSTYYSNTLLKLDIYEKNHILIGKDLILTHESNGSPLDTKVLRHYLENYLV